MQRLPITRKFFALFAILLFILYLCGCGCDLNGAGSKSGRLVVMTYNVQNLFDPYVTGNEYPEYTPEGGWSADLYRTRLERLSRALTQGHETVPDIILLQEIENAGVLADLVRLHLGSWGFQWFAATSDRDSPIQVGVVSRFPIVHAITHAVQGTRSILECTIDTGGSEITILNLHAKSRIEGVEETEPLRLATSRAASARSDEIFRMRSFHPVIIGGDFNESADAAYREGGSFTHALVPIDVPDAQERKREGALIVTGATPPNGTWHSWWLDRRMLLLATCDGSYLYRGVWETYDQLLLSPAFFDDYGWEFQRGHVASFSPLCNEKGHPDAWDVRTGKGFSDHLPVSVVLVMK